MEENVQPLEKSPLLELAAHVSNNAPHLMEAAKHLGHEVQHHIGHLAAVGSVAVAAHQVAHHAAHALTSKLAGHSAPVTHVEGSGVVGHHYSIGGKTHVVAHSTEHGLRLNRVAGEGEKQGKFQSLSHNDFKAGLKSGRIKDAGGPRATWFPKNKSQEEIDIEDANEHDGVVMEKSARDPDRPFYSHTSKDGNTSYDHRLVRSGSAYNWEDRMKQGGKDYGWSARQTSFPTRDEALKAMAHHALLQEHVGGTVTVGHRGLSSTLKKVRAGLPYNQAPLTTKSDYADDDGVLEKAEAGGGGGMLMELAHHLPHVLHQAEHFGREVVHHAAAVGMVTGTAGAVAGGARHARAAAARLVNRAPYSTPIHHVEGSAKVGGHYLIGGKSYKATHSDHEGVHFDPHVGPENKKPHGPIGLTHKEIATHKRSGHLETLSEPSHKSEEDANLVKGTETSQDAPQATEGQDVTSEPQQPGQPAEKPASGRPEGQPEPVSEGVEVEDEKPEPVKVGDVATDWKQTSFRIESIDRDLISVSRDGKDAGVMTTRDWTRFATLPGHRVARDGRQISLL